CSPASKPFRKRWCRRSQRKSPKHARRKPLTARTPFTRKCRPEALLSRSTARPKTPYPSHPQAADIIWPLWGKVMRPVLFALALAFVVLGAGRSIAEEQCQLLEAASVPMKIGGGDVPTIPVKLNGHDTYFLIDTGGAASLVSTIYAQRWQM